MDERDINEQIAEREYELMMDRDEPSELDRWDGGYDREYDDPMSDEMEQEYEPFRDDVEADADVLRSAGYGTDEDYGYFGEDFLD